MPRRRTIACFSTGARLDSMEMYSRLSNPSTAWSRVSMPRAMRLSKVKIVSICFLLKFLSTIPKNKKDRQSRVTGVTVFYL